MAFTGRIRLSLGRSQQIKDLKVALQCLFKIGSELLVEAIEDKLVLRAINTSKSAFFAVTFSSSFFDEYAVENSQVVQSAVLLKHVLATFRTQKISHFGLDLDADHSTLTITIVGENRITKTYHLECMNSEILNANIDKDSCPTQVIAEAAELNKLLNSFQSGLDEITIIANPEHRASAASMHRACQLQSFYDPEKSRSDSSLHTSLAIDTRSVFVGYQHRSEHASDVTFNVKDFRNMVTLCEHMGSNIILRFDQAGMPLVAEPHIQGMQPDAALKAELVLATLMESQLSAATTHQPYPQPAPQQAPAVQQQQHQQYSGATPVQPQQQQQQLTSHHMQRNPRHQTPEMAPGSINPPGRNSNLNPAGPAVSNGHLMRFNRGGRTAEHMDEAAGFEADDQEEQGLDMAVPGDGHEWEDSQPDPEELPRTGRSPLPSKLAPGQDQQPHPDVGPQHMLSVGSGQAQAWQQDLQGRDQYQAQQQQQQDGQMPGYHMGAHKPHSGLASFAQQQQQQASSEQYQAQHQGSRPSSHPPSHSFQQLSVGAPTVAAVDAWATPSHAQAAHGLRAAHAADDPHAAHAAHEPHASYFRTSGGYLPQQLTGKAASGLSGQPYAAAAAAAAAPCSGVTGLSGASDGGGGVVQQADYMVGEEEEEEVLPGTPSDDEGRGGGGALCPGMIA